MSIDQVQNDERFVGTYPSKYRCAFFGVQAYGESLVVLPPFTLYSGWGYLWLQVYYSVRYILAPAGLEQPNACGDGQTDEKEIAQGGLE